MVTALEASSDAPTAPAAISDAPTASPATLLGFGTWVAFGSGKVLVGVDSGDSSFDTLGETGGAKTSAHTHPLSSNGYALHSPQGNNMYDARISIAPGSVNTNHLQSYSGTASNTPVTVDLVVALGGNTDSGSTSTVQPFITVYMWRRTA